MLVYQRVGAWPKAPELLNPNFGAHPELNTGYYDLRCSLNGVVIPDDGTVNHDIATTYAVNWGMSTYIVGGATHLLATASAIAAVIVALL